MTNKEWMHKCFLWGELMHTWRGFFGSVLIFVLRMQETGKTAFNATLTNVRLELEIVSKRNNLLLLKHIMS